MAEQSRWQRVRVVLNSSEMMYPLCTTPGTLETFGFLMRLIARAAYAGLPTDPDQISRICGVSRRTVKRLWPHVDEYFELSEDGKTWQLLPSEWFTPQIVSADRKNLTALLDVLVDYWGPSCVYCGCDGDLEVEHVVPLARGGTNELTNLTVSCRDCNMKKRTKTAAEFGHPHVHRRASRIQ